MSFAFFLLTFLFDFSWAVQRPVSRGEALERCLVSSQAVFAFDAGDMRRLAFDLRVQLAGLAESETAFDTSAYSGHPLTEHCGAVAYVVQRLLGGDVLMGHYREVNGTAELWHLWNRVWAVPAGGASPLGHEIDLTRGQFGLSDEALAPPGQALRYRGRSYVQLGTREYHWDRDADATLRPAILRFWTAYLTQGRSRLPACGRGLEN